MRPPTKRNEPLAGGSKRESEVQLEHANDTTFHVVINVERQARSKLWGQYPSLQLAEGARQKLFRHGLLARIEVRR